MTIPQDLVDQGYRLLLGRLPRADNPPEFDSIPALRQVLMNSAEFKASARAQKRWTGWPRDQIFVSQAARVIYNPIGKNACTFLKQQMARMSGLPGMGFLLADVHSLTDHANLGLQISDYSAEEADAFLTSPDYLRIALLRDPRERLLSAWVEKFAVGRTVPANVFHTRSVVDPVQRRQGLETPDYARGITFRDFITEITSDPGRRLDPHWSPQSAYLAGVAWDRLFAFEDIEAMVALLEERSGIELPRMKQNTTGSGTGSPLPGAADLLPGVLLDSPRADLASFYDAALDALVRDFFAEDFRLLERARRERSPQVAPPESRSATA